jgi:predicted nuclease of predicted toxin-antitoxin system
VLRLVTDENFDGRVLRGLMARLPDLDVIRVQDVGLSGAADPAILEFAAGQRRVLLTQDVRTMTVFAGERLAAGQPMAGVVLVPQVESVGRVIEALQELVETRKAEEMKDQILYLKP